MDAQLVAWVALLASVISNGLTVWNFLQSPSKKNGERLDQLAQSVDRLTQAIGVEVKKVDDRVDEVSQRVGMLEASMHQLPDKESLHRLEINLTSLTGQLNVLTERLNPIDHLSRRLQEMLVDRSKS